MFPIKSLISGVNTLKVNKLWPNIGNVQCAFITARKKTLYEVAGLPPRPKQPLTPYFRYMTEIRPSLRAQNPDKKMVDIIRLAAHAWKTVDEGKKSDLEKEYLKDKQLFDQQLAQYDDKLTPEMRESLAKVRGERTEKRVKALVRKRNKDLDKPKRAASAFLLFLTGEYKKTPNMIKDLGRIVALQKVTEKWRNMSDAEKKPYVDESNKLRAQYKVNLEKWEARMIKEGNLDVVRNPIFDEPLTKPQKSKK